MTNGQADRLAFRALVCGVAATLAAATNAECAERAIGLKCCLSYAEAELSGNQLGSHEIVRFGAGVSVTEPTPSGFTIEGDMLYLGKGTQVLDSRTDTRQGEYQLDYWVLAPAVRYTFPVSGLCPYLVAGGELGVLVDAEAIGTPLAPGMAAGSATDVSDDFRMVDVALLFGAGIVAPDGEGPVSLEIRYSHGLVDVAERDDFGMRTRGLHVFLGIRTSGWGAKPN